MVRRRLAAVALAAMTAAPGAMPGAASGAQADDQALVRVAHFAPGLLKGTVAVSGQLTSVEAALLTDDMSRPASGKSKVRLIQAIPGEGAVDLATGGDALISNARFPSASDVQLPSGSISSLVAVGGIGQKLELLAIRDAASAVSAAGGVATGAGGTSPSPSPGGHRFALLLPLGGGLAAAIGFVVRQRRSTG
jgi:hypothetical protein